MNNLPIIETTRPHITPRKKDLGSQHVITPSQDWLNAMKEDNKRKSLLKTIKNYFIREGVEPIACSNEQLNQDIGRPPGEGDHIWILIERKLGDKFGVNNDNVPWIIIMLKKKLEDKNGGNQFAFITKKKVEGKILLKPGECWEHMSCIITTRANEARIDRMLEKQHPHNLLPKPQITIEETANLVQKDDQEQIEIKQALIDRALEEITRTIPDIQQGEFGVVIPAEDIQLDSLSNQTNYSVVTTSNSTNKIMTDNRTSDLIMALLKQTGTTATTPEVRQIVQSERILYKVLNRTARMIDSGATPEELRTQWDGVNKHIEHYVTRKEELTTILEAASGSEPQADDIQLLQSIGYNEDMASGAGIVNFNYDPLTEIARELAQEAKEIYGELPISIDQIIRTGPSTNANIENNRNPELDGAFGGANNHGMSTDDQNLMNFEKTARENLLKSSKNTTKKSPELDGAFGGTNHHGMSTDDQHLMNFERTARENLLRTSKDTTMLLSAADTPLTAKGRETPNFQETRTFTDQLEEDLEDVPDQNLRYKMEQEIIQLKRQLRQKLSVDPLNAKPPVKTTNKTDNEELKSKKRLTASILSTIMKIQRTVEDVKEFQTYINLHDNENSMNLLINLEKEAKQLRTSVDDLRQQVIVEETYQTHKENLLELQNEYEALKELIKDCKDKCAANPQQAATNFNLSKARLIQFKDVHLQILASPSIYDVIAEIKSTEEQNPILKTKMAQFFVEVILKALAEHESMILQDIKNNIKPKNAQDIITYLSTHYGQATYVENLAKQRHQKIGRLQLPFTPRNVAWSYKCLKAHLATIDSVKQMIKYHDENYGKAETDIICSQGGLTLSYQQLLLQMTPDQGMSQLNLKLQTMTPRCRLAELENCYRQLLREAHALYILSGLANSDVPNDRQLALLASGTPQKPSGENRLQNNPQSRKDGQNPPTYWKAPEEKLHRTEIRDPTLYNQSLMKIHGEIRSNKPTTESDLIVNGVKITPKKSIMDTLQLAVPDEKKRKALVTLMGPEGCFFLSGSVKKKERESTRKGTISTSPIYIWAR